MTHIDPTQPEDPVGIGRPPLEGAPPGAKCISRERHRCAFLLGYRCPDCVSARLAVNTWRRGSSVTLNPVRNGAAEELEGDP
jgi:hypothetical protein